MSKEDTPLLSEIVLYRITHIENIPHILKHGVTHRRSANANPNYKTIGDISLISKRETEKVFTDNEKTIILGDFIPFYFGTRMPMLLIIKNGFNHTTSVSQENIVYILIKLQSIIHNIPCDKYYFSDGHAINKLTRFYCADNISNLPRIIDWSAVNARYWGPGSGNLDIKRTKQAEFLIKEDIPASHIIKIGCYNERAKDKLLLMGLDEERIQIMTYAYYD